MTDPDDDIAAGLSPQQPEQGQVFPYQGPVERRSLHRRNRQLLVISPDPI